MTDEPILTMHDDEAPVSMPRPRLKQPKTPGRPARSNNPTPKLKDPYGAPGAVKTATMQKSGPGRSMLIIMLLVGLIIGAGASAIGIYYWQQQVLMSEINRLQQESNQIISDIKQELNSTKQMLTETQTKLNTETQKPETPDISFTLNDDKTEITILNKDTEIKTLNFEYETKPYILKQNYNNLYLAFETIEGPTDQYYRTYQTFVYQYNLKEQKLVMLMDDKSGRAYDVSNDDQWLVYKSSENKLVILNTENLETENFDFSQDYNLTGDIKFSPNAKKVAYVAFDQNRETDKVKSAVYIIDIENNITTKIKEEMDRQYHIIDWNGNENDQLNYYYFPFNL